MMWLSDIYFSPTKLFRKAAETGIIENQNSEAYFYHENTKSGSFSEAIMSLATRHRCHV